MGPPCKMSATGSPCQPDLQAGLGENLIEMGDNSLDTPSRKRNVGSTATERRTKQARHNEIGEEVPEENSLHGAIFQQLNILHEDLKRRLDEIDEKVSSRVRKLEDALREARADRRELYRVAILQPSPNQKEEALHGLTAEEHNRLNLPRALQQSIVTFMESFVFNGTFLPDELLQNDLLTQNEHNDLVAMENTKDQIRILILKIKRRGPDKIEKFLNAVKREQPHVVEAVYKELQKLGKADKDRVICCTCQMIKDVDMKDIADNLWKEDIIDDATYEDICGKPTASERKLLWKTIVDGINDTEDAVDVLIDTLEKKYDHIAGRLRTLDADKLYCYCV